MTHARPKPLGTHNPGDLLVQDLMSWDVITCQRTDSLLAAAKLMEKHDIGLLPVLDGRTVVGVITDRDLVLRHLVVEGASPGRTWVGTCMTPKVHSVSPDRPVDEALRLMREGRVRRLLVMDGGELRGVLTLDDILLQAGHAGAVGKVVREALVLSPPGPGV